MVALAQPLTTGEMKLALSDPLYVKLVLGHRHGVYWEMVFASTVVKKPMVFVLESLEVYVCITNYRFLSPQINY